ncbi:ABC transporter permease [Salinibacterium sp. ZJ77]|uniref:ABC transporter permease n=1 Tax=Salinibacterium sp. ZJ77 TaxID=2708337 RepID=UPI00141D9923|nr:ABC transporter permease [Salinibacterium sp. ZJ77]
MTAVTAPAAAREPGLLARTWRVTRLLTANPATVLVWPLVILAAIFLLTWSIWAIVMANIDPAEVEATSEGIRFNGAVTYIFVYFMVVAIQAVNQTFPLALGFGSTRRAFSFGTAVTFSLLSVVYATILTIAAELERATNGWGVHGAFFRSFGVATDEGIVAQWWIYFCWFVFFSFTGAIFAAVFVRWRAVGLTITFLLLGFLVVGLVALLTFTEAWGEFARVFIELGTVGVASVMIVMGVIAAFAGHALLRRATPRS